MGTPLGGYCPMPYMHTHCPFWTQKLPCFRPHSVEQFA